ncbi:MAG TPA: preprotein translocase subunit SecE [Desulfurobacteriaceae bacterium]|nr:preprotein translocase subunit SecE [Desulfurobacteriaceae bacterium]
MNLISFLREFKQILAQIHWPSKKEVYEATIGVIFIIFVISLYFFIVDSILIKILESLIYIG